MIKIQVSDYCHNCQEFYPDLNSLFGDDGMVIHYITCDNKDKCRNIRLHLEKQMKEKNNDE